MIRFLPVRIFARSVTTSRFRDSSYKRLDYPKAPSIAVVEKPAVEVQKPVFQTQKPALFGSEKEALEYELAPSDIRQQKLRKKLQDFREMQADRQGLIDSKIAQNGVFGVRKGKTPGIYLDWDTVVQEVGKLSDSEWQKHASVAAAQEYMGMYHISARDACYDPYEAPISQCERKLAEEIQNEETSGILWYAVKEGRTTGVFSDWQVAAEQVIGLPNAVYASFGTEEKAYLFLETTKEEYFRSREEKKEVAEEFVADQVKLREERDRVHLEEEQRKEYRIQSETELYVNPPQGGSAYLIKKLLTKLIQIQAEINKMGDLDKKRKFYIQGLYHELTQMDETEKEEALEALGEDEYLKEAWEVINDPEHVLYHEMYLMDKQFYKGYGKGVDLETATKEFPSGATYNTTYRSPEERLEVENEAVEAETEAETVENEAVEAETVETEAETETVSDTVENTFFTDNKPTPTPTPKKKEYTSIYADVNSNLNKMEETKKLKEALKSENLKKLKTEEELKKLKEDQEDLKKLKEFMSGQKSKKKLTKEKEVKEEKKDASKEVKKEDSVKEVLKEQLFPFYWTRKTYGPKISPQHSASLRKIALARYMNEERDKGYTRLPALPYSYIKQVNMESLRGELRQSHYDDAMKFFRVRAKAKRQWLIKEARRKEQEEREAKSREAESARERIREKRRRKKARRRLREAVEGGEVQSEEMGMEAWVGLSAEAASADSADKSAVAESAKSAASAADVSTKAESASAESAGQSSVAESAVQSAGQSSVAESAVQSAGQSSVAESSVAESAVPLSPARLRASSSADSSSDSAGAESFAESAPSFGRNLTHKSRPSALSFKFSPPPSVSRDYDHAFSLKSASRDWSTLRNDDEYRNWHHHQFHLGGDKKSRQRFAIAHHKSMSEREAVLCNSQVSYETLSKLTCNCGENIYAPSMGSPKTFPLEPRQLTYVPKKIYPNITNARYQVYRSFKEAQKDYDSETTALSDNLTSTTALLLAFNTNWRVLFNSITRKLGPIAADHHGRFERIEGNIVYTDGCYNINSSPVALNDRQAGWGVYFGDRQMPNASGRVPGEQSSERAELLGMVMAIRLISRNHEYRSQKWTICTDHAWTVNLLEYGWDGLEPKYKLKSHPNFYLIKRLRSLLFENQNITLQCVRGSGLMYGGLREAEKLARKGMMQEYIQSAKLHGEADADVLFYDPALTMHYPSVELPKAILNKKDVAPVYWTKE